MSSSSISDITKDLHEGKMCVLVDDNQFDQKEYFLIMAAEHISGHAINFMIREAFGLVCVTLPGSRCDELNIPDMAFGQPSHMAGKMTVSIEAAQGVTTGISADDRATTIKIVANPRSTSHDIVKPGHVFPIRTNPGGVLAQLAIAEAAENLLDTAQMNPSCVIVQILNDDGDLPDNQHIDSFCRKHNLNSCTLSEIIRYRLLRESQVELIQNRQTETPFGKFNFRIYRDLLNEGQYHVALIKGEIEACQPILTRVHISQTLRDLMGLDTGGWSFQDTLKEIEKEECGVLLLLDSPTGFEVVTELSRYLNESTRVPISRSYTSIGIGAQILRDLGVKKIKLMSSPVRHRGLSGFELEIVEYYQSPTKPWIR